ncbi:MAG: hypothetical protein PHU54_10030 [Candidatus Omnitrophica bacterium]|jgi:hypothetical protein|nr:hypothetical protein [Candidatus Omnitrophota bacterium]
MCKCFQAAVARGYVLVHSVYENQDFVDKGYHMPLSVRTETGNRREVFLPVHYCPTCGEKVPDIAGKERSNLNA